MKRGFGFTDFLLYLDRNAVGAVDQGQEAHRIGLELLVILLLLGAILAFIISRWQDRVAAWLFAPSRPK